MKEYPVIYVRSRLGTVPVVQYGATSFRVRFGAIHHFDNRAAAINFAIGVVKP